MANQSPSKYACVLRGLSSEVFLAPDCHQASEDTTSEVEMTLKSRAADDSETKRALILLSVILVHRKQTIKENSYCTNASDDRCTAGEADEHLPNCMSEYHRMEGAVTHEVGKL
jgi:hypothetical protein